GTSADPSRRSTTPYRTSADPSRNSPAISSGPPPAARAAGTAIAASPATAQRGSQDDGSSTTTPTTAYTVRISPGHSSMCSSPNPSRAANRRSSTSRGRAARAAAEFSSSENPMPNSREKTGSPSQGAQSPIGGRGGS